MSKNISDLQKGILLLCLGKGFLLTQDILCWWWGWEPAEWGDKKAGSQQYNAAHSSLSRSLDRLWRRGLIIIWKSITGSATGVSLSSQGREVAKAISAEEEFNG